MQLVKEKIDRWAYLLLSNFWLEFLIYLVACLLLTGSMTMILFSFGSKNPITTLYGFMHYPISRPYHIISFLVLATPMTLAFFLKEKNEKRLYGIILGMAIAIPLTIFFLGMGLYSTFGHIVPHTLTDWVDFIFNHPANTKSFKQFWLAEFVGAILVIAPFAHAFLQQENYFGNAHFANIFESLNEGFFKEQEESIIIGKKYGLPIYSNGFEHVLCASPTGSGKSRSISIPNLFNYSYSIVCNDVKLSLFETTSKYREKYLGHQCFLWAPASEQLKTHCYNPFDAISNDDLKIIRDIQRLAHIFIADNPKGGENLFWSQSSRKLFKILTLYMIGTKSMPVTFTQMSLLAKQSDFDDFLEGLLGVEGYHYDLYYDIASYLQEPDKTRGNAYADFTKRLELFDDPIICKSTSKSDFDFKLLRKNKMTIYVGFSDDDMERLSPIITMFWQHLISSMIQEIPKQNDEPYPLLCLMDEFTSLGRIDRFRRSLKLLREYRVRCVLMAQYFSQMNEQYSHDESKAFLNIKTKIVLATDDIYDAEYISKMLGVKTKKILSGSTSSQTRGDSTTNSYQYQGVPLMRPEEIVRLKVPDCLIIKTGATPIKAKQYIWYKDASLKKMNYGQSSVPLQELEIKTVNLEDFKKKKDKSSLEEERYLTVECPN